MIRVSESSTRAPIQVMIGIVVFSMPRTSLRLRSSSDTGPGAVDAAPARAQKGLSRSTLTVPEGIGRWV